MSNNKEPSKSVLLGFRTSEAKANKLKELVDIDKEFKDVTDGLETALTLLLEKYGKLGAQPKERVDPLVEGEE